MSEPAIHTSSGVRQSTKRLLHWLPHMVAMVTAGIRLVQSLSQPSVSNSCRTQLVCLLNTRIGQ